MNYAGGEVIDLTDGVKEEEDTPTQGQQDNDDKMVKLSRKLRMLEREGHSHVKLTFKPPGTSVLQLRTALNQKLDVHQFFSLSSGSLAAVVETVPRRFIDPSNGGLSIFISTLGNCCRLQCFGITNDIFL